MERTNRRRETSAGQILVIRKPKFANQNQQRYLNSAELKKFLYILSFFCLLVVSGAWVTTGSHIGWSATQVQVMKTDPVTEMEYPVWEPRLVLGVDFLGLGLLGCGVLAGIAFFVPKKKSHP